MKMKSRKQNKTLAVAVIGGILAIAILVGGTVWTGQLAQHDTEEAARTVSLLYLDELAGRREQVVEDNLKDYRNKIDVAVLTVPKDVAVAVTQRLTAHGISAIWHFTNVELTEPNSDILVENIHFSDSLLSLSYYVAERRDETAAKAGRATQ